MPDEITLEDEYGKRTRFRGTQLASITTDADDRPQWADLDIWRTEAGAYVVQRKTTYRIRHLTDRCSKFGVNIVPRQATEADDYPCPKCNQKEIIEPGQGYGQENRIAVDVARSPDDLIRLLMNRDRTYAGYVRAALADVSDQDEDVAAIWLEEVVP